jgi:protein ImuA
MASLASAHELVASLRREVARLEAGRPPENERPISTGSAALDRLLPAGGLRRGTLVEYLRPAAGSGAGMLALVAAREACRDGRAFVVLDRPIPTRSASEGERFGRFYPPAAAAWGIDLSAMLVLRPDNDADALWALDQALRCPGVGAVWATCDRLDVRDFRRLQLAAECGGTLGRCAVAGTKSEVRSTKYEEQKAFFSSFVLRPSYLRGACSLPRRAGRKGRAFGT